MKTSFKNLALTTLALLLVISFLDVNAQENSRERDMEQKKERFEAQKVAFITDRLDLSSAEAEKFWPIYNAYKDEQKAAQKAWRIDHDYSHEDIIKMSDSDAEKFTKDQLGHEQILLDLRKALITNMKGVISPQKIVMLLEAEKEFRVDLMRKVSHGQGQGIGRSEDRK